MFTLIVPHPRAVTVHQVDTDEIERILGVELWYLWLYLFEELNIVRPYPGGYDRFITSVEADMQTHDFEYPYENYRVYLDNYDVINECVNYLYACMRQTLINIMMRRPVIRTYDPEYIHIGAICHDSLILHLFDSEVEKDDWCRKNNNTQIVLDNNRWRTCGPRGFI